MGHYDDCYEDEDKTSVGMVAKRWIIARAPGKVPTIKRPVNSDDGLIDMLREMISLYPDYQFTVVRLVYGDNIWVDDGAEYLNIHDVEGGNMKTICLECRYAEWLRDAKGRLHRSGEGHCRHEYKMPQLPVCRYWGPLYGGTPSPNGGQLDRHRDTHQKCPYFQRPKEEKAK